MTIGRTSSAVLGLVAGVALGVGVGASWDADRDVPETRVAAAEVASVAEPEPVKAKATPKRVKAVPVTAPVEPAAPVLVMTMPASAPELHDRLKPVLARGTRIPAAAEGFKDAVQFATVAHAARNTQVPFILLKHRVLVEGKSLEDAIRASKPDLDVQIEAVRARAEARNDIATLSATN